MNFLPFRRQRCFLTPCSEVRRLPCLVRLCCLCWCRLPLGWSVRCLVFVCYWGLIRRSNWTCQRRLDCTSCSLIRGLLSYIYLNSLRFRYSWAVDHCFSSWSDLRSCSADQYSATNTYSFHCTSSSHGPIEFDSSLFCSFRLYDWYQWCSCLDCFCWNLRFVCFYFEIAFPFGCSSTPSSFWSSSSDTHLLSACYLVPVSDYFHLRFLSFGFFAFAFFELYRRRFGGSWTLRLLWSNCRMIAQ